MAQTAILQKPQDSAQEHSLRPREENRAEAVSTSVAVARDGTEHLTKLKPNEHPYS